MVDIFYKRARLSGLLIEDVTLVKAERITIHVRFRGGQTTSMEIDRLKPIALIRKTLSEVIAKGDEILETCSVRQVAEQLNVFGYTNWKGESFTHKKVFVVRTAYWTATISKSGVATIILSGSSESKAA